MLNHTRFCLFLIFLACLPVIVSHPVLAQVDDLFQQQVTLQPLATTTAGKTTTFLFKTQQVGQEYNGVILSGTATGDFSQGFIRFQAAAGWTEWFPLKYLDTSTKELFLAGYRDNTFRPGTAFELRFNMPAGTSINLTGTGVFDNRLDEDEGVTTQSAEHAHIPPVTATIDPPALIPRGEWGADSFVGNPVPLANPSYNRMTFHHAACCGASTYEEGIAQVKGIQDFHQEVRGWSDIGYHFVFDQSGRLYQGRPFLDNRTDLNLPPVLAQGAHVGGANTGNIGVAVLGCYHPPEGGACVDVMSTALRDSLVTLYAYLSERYGVDTENLFGHRDQSATSCPGDNNYALLPSLRTEIDGLKLSGGQPRPTTFFLAENFPNPFVSSTTIRYYLDQEGFVSIKVYDTAGRLVSSLVDAYQDADQWYTAEFLAGNLGNGTYFYRMQVVGFSDVIFDETRTLSIIN